MVTSINSSPRPAPAFAGVTSGRGPSLRNSLIEWALRIPACAGMTKNENF